MTTETINTRAIKWNGTLRVATNDDGPAIGKLFAATGLDDLGVDWNEANPEGWWLVGEREGQIVGAIQIAAGRPYGFIGDIVVHPNEQGQRGEERGLSRSSLTVTLYAWAFEVIRRNGGQYAIGVTNDPRVRAMLTRYGGQSQGEFTLFAKKLV